MPADPHDARIELTKIRERVGTEVFGESEAFVNDLDTGSSDLDNEELTICDGPDGEGLAYSVHLASARAATESDYDAAIGVIRGLAGWTVGSIDPEPVDGLSTAVFVNEELGGIVLAFRQYDGALGLDLRSHCVAGATED